MVEREKGGYSKTKGERGTEIGGNAKSNSEKLRVILSKEEIRNCRKKSIKEEIARTRIREAGNKRCRKRRDKKILQQR